jgi:hypothetical protein
MAGEYHSRMLDDLYIVFFEVFEYHFVFKTFLGFNEDIFLVQKFIYKDLITLNVELRLSYSMEKEKSFAAVSKF